MDVNNDSTAEGENNSGNYLTAADFDPPLPALCHLRRLQPL